MANDRNQTGDDVELVIDGEVVPVTDKGWTDTRDWAESNFDDSKSPDRGLAARSTEGDLEYDGTKQELERKLHEAPQNKHRLIFRRHHRRHRALAPGRREVERLDQLVRWRTHPVLTTSSTKRDRRTAEQLLLAATTS